MKEPKEKCLICTMFLVAGLICLFVGWIVWIKSGDSFTTGVALLLMAISFFIRPLATGQDKHDLAGTPQTGSVTGGKHGPTQRVA